MVCGLTAIALTDHDTLGGVPEAVSAANGGDLRVIAGCEFSASSTWGEVHVLAYFLPLDDTSLNHFIILQQDRRLVRATSMVDRLDRLGIAIGLDDVLEEASGGVLGRPHVARTLVKCGAVKDVQGAFRKYLGADRPAYVPKELPTLAEVAAVVRRTGGTTSAAHLRELALDPDVLDELVDAGVDAVEVMHPSHHERRFAAMEAAARRVGLLATGGSDWHGEESGGPNRTVPGSLNVPVAWLGQIEALHRERSVVEPVAEGGR
jgi:hypothetical protein